MDETRRKEIAERRAAIEKRLEEMQSGDGALVVRSLGPAEKMHGTTELGDLMAEIAQLDAEENAA